MTIVIPVLDDAAATTADPAIQIVIADGGHDLALDALTAHRQDTSLVRTTAGRGIQMNAGADAATEPWLLFLHADSRLPVDWLDALRGADQAAGFASGSILPRGRLA